MQHIRWRTWAERLIGKNQFKCTWVQIVLYIMLMMYGWNILSKTTIPRIQAYFIRHSCIANKFDKKDLLWPSLNIIINAFIKYKSSRAGFTIKAVVKRLVLLQTKNIISYNWSADYMQLYLCNIGQINIYLWKKLATRAFKPLRRLSNGWT